MSIRSDTQPAHRGQPIASGQATDTASSSLGTTSGARAKRSRRLRESLLEWSDPQASDPRSPWSQLIDQGAALGRFAYGWSGVWVSLLLILQFTQLGLKPAQAERERLSEWTPEIEDNYWEAREAFEWLEAEAIAWQDPVYRERRRRIQKFGLPTRAESEFAAAESSTAWDGSIGEHAPSADPWSTTGE